METGKPAYLLSNLQLRRRLQAECADMPLDADQEAALDSPEQAMDNEIELNVEGNSSSRHWIDDEDINHEFLVSDKEDISENLSENTEFSNKLTVELAEWAIESGLGRDKINKLLSILNRHKINVPKTAKTLLRTPSRIIVTRKVNPGEYYHFGIEKNLIKLNYDFLYRAKQIDIDIGIDGLPLFKSSKLQLWPILGAFVDRKNVSPFIIGVYSGSEKPENIDEFLLDFVNEVQLLISQGIRVTQNKLRKKFSIRCFVCDAPAKSYVMGIVGHTSFHGCPKCSQVGTYVNRTVVYSTTVSQLYSDSTFKNRDFPSFHSLKYFMSPTILEGIGVGMISQFVVDPMHLIDLGVVRKMLNALVKGETLGFKLVAVPH